MKLGETSRNKDQFSLLKKEGNKVFIGLHRHVNQWAGDRLFEKITWNTVSEIESGTYTRLRISMVLPVSIYDEIFVELRTGHD